MPLHSLENRAIVVILNKQQSLTITFHKNNST